MGRERGRFSGGNRPQSQIVVVGRFLGCVAAAADDQVGYLK